MEELFITTQTQSKYYSIADSCDQVSHSVKDGKSYHSYREGQVMTIEILEKRFLPCFSEALKISSIAKIDSSRMSGM